MKKNNVITFAKRFFTGNLLAACLFLSAQAHETTGVSKVTTPVEIKYAGIDKNEQHAFSMHYSNPAGNTFLVQILDENGETIFIGRYADKQFDKTFRIPKLGFGTLQFILRDQKSDVLEKFSVNITSRTIEEVKINKSK
jgi:hypothetical protein